MVSPRSKTHKGKDGKWDREKTDHSFHRGNVQASLRGRASRNMKKLSESSGVEFVGSFDVDIEVFGYYKMAREGGKFIKNLRKILKKESQVQSDRLG